LLEADNVEVFDERTLKWIAFSCTLMNRGIAYVKGNQDYTGSISLTIGSAKRWFKSI